MDIYVGNGDVVKMECKKTGDRKNPNMHEWVLRTDAENKIERLKRKVKKLEKDLSDWRDDFQV